MDVVEAGFLIFDKYRQLKTGQAIAAFKQRYPNLQLPRELMQKMEKTVFHRIQRCAGLVFEDPILEAMQMHFPREAQGYDPNFHSFNQRHPY